MTEAFFWPKARSKSVITKTANWFGFDRPTSTPLTSSANRWLSSSSGWAFFLRAKVTSTGVSGWCPVCSSRRSPSRCANQIEEARSACESHRSYLPLGRHAFPSTILISKLVVGTCPFAILRPRKKPPSCSRLPGRRYQLRARASPLFVFVCLPTWRESGAAASFGHPVAVLKGPRRRACTDQTWVEELAKAPSRCRLRLFGKTIFAGGILVSLIALFPPLHHVGAQTRSGRHSTYSSARSRRFIFALLTILYFSQADGAGRGTRVRDRRTIAGSQTSRQTW